MKIFLTIALFALIALTSIGFSGKIREADTDLFIDYCLQSNPTEEIKITIDALFDHYGTSNCEDTKNKLQAAEELDLSETDIISVAPLSGLTNLKELNLSMNYIDNIAPLSTLTNLESLILSDQWLNFQLDLSPLATLINLKHLEAESCLIESLEGLQNLVALEELILSDNYIEDLSPLSEMHLLNELSLQYNSVTSLAPISLLESLDTLSIDKKEIEKNIESCPYGDEINPLINNICKKYLQ